MTFIGIAGSRLPSSRVCVSSSTVSTYQTHQDAISRNAHKHPSSHCPAICSVSIDPRSLHGSRMHSDFTRRCSLYKWYSCQGREAREMYLVSIVSFGAELGRPSIRLMFNSSHNITKRFPPRCFVIKSAGLAVPQIFSILNSWFFSFCCSQKYFVSTCLIAPHPLRRASPRAAAASVQIRT